MKVKFRKPKSQNIMRNFQAFDSPATKEKLTAALRGERRMKKRKKKTFHLDQLECLQELQFGHVLPRR